MPRFPADNVLELPADNVSELPDLDHRDADVTFGGCGDPTCPTGRAHLAD